jgi:hypothetical protein
MKHKIKITAPGHYTAYIPYGTDGKRRKQNVGTRENIYVSCENSRYHHGSQFGNYLAICLERSFTGIRERYAGRGDVFSETGFSA